jgi:hypothetical protein
MAARESVTAWTSALGGGLLNRLFLFPDYAGCAVLELPQRRIVGEPRFRHR